jgi:hypothetical protein
LQARNDALGESSANRKLVVVGDKIALALVGRVAGMIGGRQGFPYRFEIVSHKFLPLRQNDIDDWYSKTIIAAP